jgi:hypothetical protein
MWYKLQESLAALKLLYRVYRPQFEEEVDQSLAFAVQSVLWLDLINIVFASYEYYSSSSSSNDAAATRSDPFAEEEEEAEHEDDSQDQADQDDQDEGVLEAVIRESTSAEIREMRSLMFDMVKTTTAPTDDDNKNDDDGGDDERQRGRLRKPRDGAAAMTGLQRVRRLINETIEFYLNHIRGTAKLASEVADCSASIYAQFLSGLPCSPKGARSASLSPPSGHSSDGAAEAEAAGDDDVTVLNGLMQTFMESFFVAFPQR